MTRRRQLVGAVQVGVTLGVMALLWTRLDMGEAGQRLSGAAPGWLLAAVVALVVQTGLMALRWKVTARLFGIEIGAGRAVAEYFLAQVVNQSLPGGILGDVGRALRARAPAGLVRAGQSVLVERLWGQIALFAVMLSALVAAPGGIVLPPLLVSSIAAVALGTVLAALVLAAAPFLPGPAGRWAAPLAATLRRGLLSFPAGVVQGALSLAAVAANLLAFAFCARATGTALSPGAVLLLVPVILFTMVVPLSVSGWGLREGAAAALFPLAGASAEAGLAASVTFGLVFLASSLPGLPVLLFERAGMRAVPADKGATEGFDAPELARRPRSSRI